MKRLLPFLLILGSCADTASLPNVPTASDVRDGIESGASTIARAAADRVYGEWKKKGMSLENGPCLSEDAVPDWVIDIAHNPRLPIDDLPENQCPAYREGRAKHLLELEPNGAFIRVR